MIASTQPATLMSTAERQLWQKDGFLHIRGALDPAQTQRVLAGTRQAETDLRKMTAEAQAQHCGATGSTASDDLRIRNAVALGPFMDDLIDHLPIYGRAVALLGPYLQVCGTEVLLRKPFPHDALAVHVDGGAGLGRMIPDFTSTISHVKALYFLTDVNADDHGNVVLIPGTHTEPLPETAKELAAHPARARSFQLHAAAGDAILFPSTLWHAVAPNRGDTTRTSVVVWYSQTWARPVDYVEMTPSVLSRLTDRQRLMFGDLDHRPVAHYLPSQPDYLPTMLRGLPSGSPELTPFLDDRRSHVQDDETGR
jgi:hypothetical protein